MPKKTQNKLFYRGTPHDSLSELLLLCCTFIKLHAKHLFVNNTTLRILKNDAILMNVVCTLLAAMHAGSLQHP